jgi:hypothetical protein
MPAVPRRKPSPQLSGILTACDRPAKSPSNPAAGRSSLTTTRPVPDQSAGGVRTGRESAGICGLVRAGSARHRKPLVYAGRQRSRPAYKNRRSHGLHRSGLGLPSSMGPGSNPARPLPRADGPGYDGGATGSSLTLRRVGAYAADVTSVVLAGRATSVPFTAVLNSPQRTTTDNATAAATCAVRRLCR